MHHGTKILIPRRALVAVSGQDALHLLQRLVTADLTPLHDHDGALYTLLLTPQGKYRFDFFVVKQNDKIYLDAPVAQAGALITALEQYRLRAVAGFEILPAATVLLDKESNGDILSFKDPRHDGLGWRNWLQDASPAGGPFDYDALRIGLGVVEPSDDIPETNAMPLEYGLDKMGAISFSKGCYLGQELTARMHNRDLAKYEVVIARDANNENGTVLAQVGELRLLQVRRDRK